MNKLMTIGMAAFAVAGFANAQNDMVITGQGPVNDAADTEVTFEGALVSSHVWRGLVYNNDMVFQPQVTASQYGISLNVWANFDMGKNYNGTQGDFSEIDLSLAYTLPKVVNDVAFDVGVISYNYPATGDGDTGAASTTELFGKATVVTLEDYVIPSVTFFGDFDEADGAYILFDLLVPYEISDYLSVAGGTSIGWGNTSYNDYYFGPTAPGSASKMNEGVNDYNFYGSVTYEITEGLYASLSLQYTMLAGGQIEDGARDRYDSKEKFFGGINIAYDF